MRLRQAGASSGVSALALPETRMPDPTAVSFRDHVACTSSYVKSLAQAPLVEGANVSLFVATGSSRVALNALAPLYLTYAVTHLARRMGQADKNRRRGAPGRDRFECRSRTPFR